MRGIRKQAHQTLAAQKHALIGEELTDFRVGDRVMTVDGFPGRVAEVSFGPYQGTEDYEVVLEGGMGGGTYSPGQLRPMAANTASLVEASEIYASIPFEAVTDHTANNDYPELEDILTQRLPNENIKVFASSTPVPSDDDNEDESAKLDQTENHVDPEDANSPQGVDDSDATEDPDNKAPEGTEGPNVTPPSACSFCGNANFKDPQMTGRGTRIECADCGGTMKSWGGKWQDDEAGSTGGPQQAQSQWEPEFPNSSQNNASEVGDYRSGGVGGVVQAPGVDFKASSLQTNAGIIDWVVNKIYDRIQERNQNSLLSRDWAAPSHAHDLAGPAGNCSQCIAQNSALPDPQTLHPHGLTIHSGLNDEEWGFHLTASWMDVQAKARKIRRTGGVKIVSSSNLYVVGEVQGDNNVYESQLNYVVGTKKVADWACGCKWASYTWGRSPAFKRFEGRLCSHALALQYEAGARGMFGREVGEEAGHGKPVSVQWDKANDQHLLRSSSLLDSDGVFPEPEALDLHHPPIYALAQNMINHGEPLTRIVQMLGSFSMPREATRSIVQELWLEPAIEWAESHAKRSVAAGWYIDAENGLDDVTASSSVNQTLWDQNAERRDLSDHDHEPDHQTDGKKHKKHRTNDAREHAPHWGWGYGGVGTLLCNQCMGSGCGHCAGTGQISQDQASTDTQPLTDQTPDQTTDAGDASTTSGVSASLKHAVKNEQHYIGYPAGGGLAHLVHSETIGRYNMAVSRCGREVRVTTTNAQGRKKTHQDQLNSAPEQICLACQKAFKKDSQQKTADYSVNDPLAGVGGQGYAVPPQHSNSQNPASTGWATSQDPGDWGRSLISNDFGVTFDASLHTAKSSSPLEGPTVSGVALKAADTGRVLMIQRSNKDESDPAKGTWEFPGGHHEEGDQTSLHAGIREWQEETGQPFPVGGHVTHVHRTGPYNLHTVVIPEESQVKFHEGRSLDNPDDPDGDDHENAAWWEPDHARKNPALRNELKGHPSWGDIKKAATNSGPEWPVDEDAPSYWPKANRHKTIELHPDDIEGLNSTQRYVDPNHPAVRNFDREKAESDLNDLPDLVNDEDGQTWINDGHHRLWGAQLHDSPIKARIHFRAQKNGAISTPCQTPEVNYDTTIGDRTIGVTAEMPMDVNLDAQQAETLDGNLHNMMEMVLAPLFPPPYDPPHKVAQQELTLDDVLGVYTTLHDDPEPALPSTDGAEDVQGSVLAGDSVDGPHDTDDSQHIVAQFLESKGAAAIIDGDRELAAKLAMKDFSHAEQQELINEGMGDRARNFGDLKIAGTHYEKLPEDNDDNLWFL